MEKLEEQILLENNLTKIESCKDSSRQSVLNFHIPRTLAVPVTSSTNFDELLDVVEENESVLLLDHVAQKKVTPKKSSAYSKIKNHHELHQLGMSFSEDVEAGKNIFSFVSGIDPTACEQTLIGVAAHLEYHSDHRIIIVSSNKSKFDNYFKESDYVEVKPFDAKLFFSKDNIILWNIPTPEKLLSSIDKYYPAIEKLSSCSIVIEQNKTTYQQINKLRDFYTKYKVEIKGLIVDRGDVNV